MPRTNSKTKTGRLGGRGTAAARAAHLGSGRRRRGLPSRCSDAQAQARAPAIAPTRPSAATASAGRSCGEQAKNRGRHGVWGRGFWSWEWGVGKPAVGVAEWEVPERGQEEREWALAATDAESRAATRIGGFGERQTAGKCAGLGIGWPATWSSLLRGSTSNLLQSQLLLCCRYVVKVGSIRLGSK
jgi:hypothetical protein